MEERIVNKAQELMFQTGVKHVTMDDLATQLGISKKTIYQYYKDKDSLVTAVVEKELSNHAQGGFIATLRLPLTQPNQLAAKP